MQIWDQFLSRLEKKWGHETVNRWLRSLKVARFDAANLYLEAQDSFQISWFEEHVRSLIEKEPLANNNGRCIRIHLSLPATKKPQAKTEPSHSNAIQSDMLDPEMSLEHFLPSGQNAMAIQVISEIATIPFNPIYLYGPEGSGKTHLLMAAALELKKLGKNVFYVRAEKFTEHVVQAIRLGHMQDLRKSYRSATALLVDDIHIFARKAATQEEFFHTFNDLHTRGCPILLSSRLPPSKLNEIEPRLISRFEWGIAIGLERQDLKQILEKKAALWKLKIDPQLIPYLLETFPSSALLALTALTFRAADSARIDPDLARRLLKDLLEKEALHTWTPEKIVKAIAAQYGIPSADLLGKSQMRESVVPRQIAMYLCREKLKLPFQKIGEIFGRDHSTVMASVRLIQNRIEEKKPDILEAVAQIM